MRNATIYDNRIARFRKADKLGDSMSIPTVLVTSPSGVGTGTALERLIQYASRRGSLSVVADIEKSLAAAHEKFIETELPKIPPEYVSAADDLEFQEELLRAEPSSLRYLMLHPPRYLDRIWRDALVLSLDDVRWELSREESPHCLLRMHATYYNTESRRFVTSVDLPYLDRTLEERGFEPQQVVTLIDDIWNVFVRLSRRNQLWHRTDQDSSLTDTWEIIHKLLVILEWRSLEIGSAESIASQLGVPHVILAVKHPISVAYDIVFRDSVDPTISVPKKDIVYLSHPITEPRRLLQRGGDREYELWTDQISQLIAAVSESRKLIPIFPTSIDELRLPSSQVGFHGVLESLLEELNLVFRKLNSMDSWTDQSTNSLSEAFANLRLRHSELTELNAKHGFSPRWPSPIRTRDTLFEGDDELEALEQRLAIRQLELQPALSTLEDQIRRQVNSRDRKLVEQSDLLVLWRPYFNGNFSSGVQTELIHRNDEVRLGLRSPGAVRCFAFLPRKDTGLLRRRYLLETLLAKQKLRSTTGRDLSDAEYAAARRTISTELDTNVSPENFEQGTLTGAILSQCVDRSKYVLRDVVEESKTLDAEKEVLLSRSELRIWQELAELVNNRNPVLDLFIFGDQACEQVGGYDLDPDSPDFEPRYFVQWVESLLSGPAGLDISDSKILT